MNSIILSFNTKATPAAAAGTSVPFTAALAHEIRGPLTNINLSTEMLEAEITNDNLKMFLDIIKRSSVRINNLINELLRYQQSDILEAEKHSVCELLDEVLEMAEDRIRVKKITVRKEYAAQDCKLLLNSQKIKMALTNIIVNAIDAMTREKGRLRLVTKSMKDKYILQIEDNGCGISNEKLKKIFKPYFTNHPFGLGSGLTTAYDILRSNQVGVNVKSKEGKGTSFILLFNKNASI